MTWTALIPVKHTSIGKSRLAPATEDRAALARAIAQDTIEAVADCPEVTRVVVITSDADLAATVPDGVQVLGEPDDIGIDAALASAAAHVGEDVPRFAILGDLPALLPSELSTVLSQATGAAHVVPDAEGSGTTVLTASAGTAWTSAFGAGSCARHRSLGAEPIDVPGTSGIRRDVDVPADLAALAGRCGRHTAMALGEGVPEVRIVAVDMDGTLLDADGRVPERLWPMLDDLHRRGIEFVPASGRQHASLEHVFERAPHPLDYIAENGAYVTREGVEVSSNTLDPDVVQSVIARVRALRSERLRPSIVRCGTLGAQIDDPDPEFGAQAATYYRALELVEDIAAVDGPVLKLAIYDPDGAEDHTSAALHDLTATHQVVVAGARWVDVMNQGVDKGVALRRLQEALGAPPEETVAFGDFLNDVELLRAAGWSYAMGNAHPRVKEVARFVAPGNADEGVITVLEQLLRRMR